MTISQQAIRTALAAFITAAAQNAAAIPLSDLLTPGAFLTAGSALKFDQWTATVVGQSAETIAPNPALIDVSALDDGGSTPGPGLAFTTTDQLQVTGDDVYAFIDYRIGFHASTLDGSPIIEDNLLELTAGNIAGSSNLGMTIVETVTDLAGTKLAEKMAEYSALDGVEYSSRTAHAAWKPGQSEIVVWKNILVWSESPLETAMLVGFEQRFSSVPEPASLALLATGFLGIGASRKSVRSNGTASRRRRHPLCY